MNGAQREWMRLLTEAVHAATGDDPANCAEPARVILKHLSREFGGHRVYVPAVPGGTKELRAALALKERQ